MELEERILKTAALMSVTGSETREAEALSALMSGFDEDFTDTAGNRFFVRRCGRENAPRILIDTHFDEIGLMVSEIHEGGFLSAAPVGGLDNRTLPSARVYIYGEKVITGVVVSTPPHLASADGKEQLKTAEELRIDTGYPTEELRVLAPVGTPIGFEPVYRRLAGKRISGKGFDNKACAAIAAQALLSVPAQRLCGDVYLLFSVHEETDRVSGAFAGAFRICPDYAMVLDVNLASMPGADSTECVLLGKGPSITRGPVPNRRLTELLECACERAGISYQTCVTAGSTGTNACSVNLAGSGIPVVDAGIPLRNMHTYEEILDLSDAEKLEEMVRIFVTDVRISEAFS